MDTDEAWERFCRDTVPVAKSSVSEKLDTLAAAVNEMRTDVERTAQIVPSIMGDEAAVDTANSAAAAGAPSMDPLGMGGVGDVSGGTGMDLAGDAMATNDELPPEMQDAAAPPVPSEPPAPVADETMPPADAGMGDAPLPEGPAEAPAEAPTGADDDDWTDEDDAFLERILAEIGDDEDIGAPDGIEMPEEAVPATTAGGASLRDTFNNALKDAYANAVDSNDSEAIAALGKLREKIAPLLDEFSAITEGPAEAPMEAGIEDAAVEESPEEAPVADADIPSDVPVEDGAPEEKPSEKGSEAGPGESDGKKDAPAGDKADEKEDESGKDEKKDDDKDKVEKSCDDSEAIVDDSIEKVGIGDAGAAEALMDEGAAKQAADGSLKDAEDTLAGTKKSADAEVPEGYGASFAELRKSNGFGAGLLGALIDDAAAEQAPQVYATSIDPMAKKFSEESEFISSARSIFDMKIGTPKDVPDLNDRLREPETFPQKDGHQDPAGIADAKQPEPSKVNDSDNGEQEASDFADADMERGKNQNHEKVKMPVIKSEEEEDGKHIMTFREMCRMAKGDRPSLAASTLAGEADDAVAKSTEPVRMGRGVDPMDVIMDDLDAYNIFKEKSEF